MKVEVELIQTFVVNVFRVKDVDYISTVAVDAVQLFKSMAKTSRKEAVDEAANYILSLNAKKKEPSPP